VHVERRDDGYHLPAPKEPLLDYPVRITDRLHHWAAARPIEVFMAERNAARGWRQITYAELLASSRHIASALLARGLSPRKPVVIPLRQLDRSCIDRVRRALCRHPLLSGIAGLFAGVAGLWQARLSHEAADAGLVFADDASKFADALAANVSPGTEIAASRGTVPGRDVTSLADLMATPLHPHLDAMHEAIGPDTIAKFLLTSGSTGNPKAVINTQRMICANQVMLRETLAFLKDEPPVIVDWLPWNHTFGGNHNIGLTLYNGGSMYLDEGKPMPGGIEETVRNLQEISPTVYFNVPKGYESLLPYLRDDSALRKKFFRPPACDVLLGRGAVGLRLEQSRRTFRAGNRLSRADADRSRRHRDRAVLHVGQSADQPFRACRAAGAGQ
jgi:feruloyl-CoA synthase